MKLKVPERRRFIRIEVPLKIVVKAMGKEEIVTTKNISPVGIRFSISWETDKTKNIDMLLYVPVKAEPIALTGRIVWQEKVSLEDSAPYDVGVEIIDICEENKNVFLKYLCDLLYKSAYEFRT